MEGKLIKTGDQFLLRNKENEVIAITSGTMEGRMLSLKNCQAIEREYDLDELAKIEYPICEVWNDEEALIRELAFKKGFQKALELLGDKKFSEEQLKDSLLDFISEVSCEDGKLISKTPEDAYNWIENHVQSLQQTEWDVEIEMEQYVKYVPKSLATVYPTGGVRPKLDNNGCLILKRK